MREVIVEMADLRLLGTVVSDERVDALLERSALLEPALDDRSVVNINSTAEGGGVAEMLHVLLPYPRGVGVDARWAVIRGDALFFALTKRLHNHLYGSAGDAGALGEYERRHYEAVLHENAAQLATVVRSGDIVVLHDPQTAGLAEAMRRRGAQVIWRCHIGTDTSSAHTEMGWQFLRRYLEPPAVDAYVFSRRAFAPSWMPAALVHEIPPSIDPFSAKNQEITIDDARSILTSAGLLAGSARRSEYRRPDGARRHIEHGADVLRTGPPPDPDVPMVVQISRWDRLKDMVGVLNGFADLVATDGRAQLVLAGPVVTAVADDPEGAEVLDECRDAWRRLPHHARSRIALACLPMTDPVENAIIVNSLQRHAAIVTQKSLAEGFGLTVSEGMYKRRPVIASAVGGIADQIVNGESGVLLPDPSDLDAFGSAIAALLADPVRRKAMGTRAHERVVERFLPDTQLLQWAHLLEGLITRPD